MRSILIGMLLSGIVMTRVLKLKDDFDQKLAILIVRGMGVGSINSKNFGFTFKFQVVTSAYFMCKMVSIATLNAETV